MYEFNRSELMAREKLRVMHRSNDETNDETLRAGVAYAPESAEVSSAPTDSTPSSHYPRHEPDRKKFTPFELTMERQQIQTEESV